MNKAIQTQITWSVNREMDREEFEAYAISATPIDAKPADEGMVTLGNGAKRVAHWMTGSFTGKRVLQYRTPAGWWRNASKDIEATFTTSE